MSLIIIHTCYCFSMYFFRIPFRSKQQQSHNYRICHIYQQQRKKETLLNKLSKGLWLWCMTCDCCITRFGSYSIQHFTIFITIYCQTVNIPWLVIEILNSRKKNQKEKMESKLRFGFKWERVFCTDSLVVYIHFFCLTTEIRK